MLFLFSVRHYLFRFKVIIAGIVWCGITLWVQLCCRSVELLLFLHYLSSRYYISTSFCHLSQVCITHSSLFSSSKSNFINKNLLTLSFPCLALLTKSRIWQCEVPDRRKGNFCCFLKGGRNETLKIKIGGKEWQAWVMSCGGLSYISFFSF